MALKRAKANRLLSLQNKESGTGRSRPLVSTPSRRRSITPTTSLEDERHRGWGLVFVLNGRLEKINEGCRRRDGEGTRSTNATMKRSSYGLRCRTRDTPICSSNGAVRDVWDVVGILPGALLDCVNPDADSAPSEGPVQTRKVQRAWTRTVG